MTRHSVAGLWPYATVAALSLAIVAVLMELWRADLHVPFAYTREALFNALVVKATLQFGWPLDVPALGAPGRLDLRDLPLGDNNLHFLVLRLLGLVSSDYAMVMNLFFLLTFPLTAMSALHVFRRFGLGVWPSLLGSVLYPFLTYHFQRGQHHLFLAAYAVVPLTVMVALWIASGALAAGGAPGEPPRRGWRRPKLLASAIVCALAASSGVYYAFFACFLMLVAGGVAALRARRPRDLAPAVGLVVLTFAVLAANYWPSIRYVHEHGGTRLVWRSPVDAEVYGLRLWQLLAPVTGHRLAPLAQFKEDLNTGRARNESDDAALGVIGSLGFLALLVRLVVPKRDPARDGDRAPGVMGDLSVLNLSGVLLATSGGFGALVALALPQIRAYNRMSIYLAFFALFAVAAGLDRLERRFARERVRRVAFALGLAVLLVLGLYDQTSVRTVPPYEKAAAEYQDDVAFFRVVRGTFPPGLMIFQLPAVPFPEHPPLRGLQEYDHARAYLHASRLRWSYGAMRGRDEDAWHAWVAAQPVPRMLDTLVAAGFSGLSVNRWAYPDDAARLTAEIAGALGAPAVNARHPRLTIFDLRPYAAALRARHTAAEWDARQDAARHPLLVIWEHGCFEPEGTPPASFRWCRAAGEWRLVNGGRQARRVTFAMSLASNHEGTLWLDSPFIPGQLPVGPLRRSLSQVISIPPGRHTIRFRCDAPRARASGDARHLVFRVHDFSVTPAE